MICPNCKNQIMDNVQYCPHCGTNIYNNVVQNTIQNNEHILVENENKGQKNSKIKKFISRYKYIFLIAFIIIIVVYYATSLYEKYIGFVKLSWNDSYLEYNAEYITQSKIKLGVNFSDKTKVNNIKYEYTCGEIEKNGLEITWNLSNSLGECEISASYKNQTIKKKYTVISYNLEENMNLKYSIDEDSDEDLDGDGLTNKQEKEYKTNPELSDTDMDGLDDNYEVVTSKTDPLIKDTDNDRLSDYDEIELGLDPLKSDSKGDGLKDGERELNYNYKSDNVLINITGKGNIASTILNVDSNTKISEKNGFIDNLYTLHTDGTIKEASLIINYTDEELKKYGLSEDNLSIYYFNIRESKYEKIDSVVDKNNKTITAKLKHFSHYVVGDTTKVKESTNNQVLFILDNSWSMYSIEQYEKFSGNKLENSSELAQSDPSGIRFTLTSELVSRLSKKNYQIGLSEFRQDYKNAISIGNNAEEIKEKLTDMTGKFITNSEGTNIGNALSNGISEFSDESDAKYIIILTDGEDNTLKPKVDNIIKTALSNNVKICSIGFGEGANNIYLSNISNATGCKLYSSSNANGLSELFDSIGAELDDDIVYIEETSDDGTKNTIEGILLADSGFVVNRDGFSFRNYSSNFSGGHCYGMATFAQLYYMKKLPMSLKKKADIPTSIKSTGYSYAYDLNGTYFQTYKNLYDYKLQTNALKYKFGFDIFGESNPSLIRTFDGDNFVINSKYKNDINDSNLYDINLIESSLSKEERINTYGVNFNKMEKIQLNEDKIQTSKVIKKDDLQMFNAIYASFLKQFVVSNYSSSINGFLLAKNAVKTESTKKIDEKGFLNILKTRLNDKDPVVISAAYDGDNELHAINAIDLIQDSDNSNIYYIGVYDNNYPGEKRYVKMECKKNKCVTQKNNYYSGSNEPIRITPSLEYDLSYYNE